MHLVKKAGTSKKALLPAWGNPGEEKQTERRADLPDVVERTKLKAEKCKRNHPLPHAAITGFPVPVLICGCWMSKPGSWLPFLWPASPHIMKLLLPLQVLFACCILSSPPPPPPCCQMPAWRITHSSVPCCRMLHIMPLKEKTFLSARATYLSYPYHLPGL